MPSDIAWYKETAEKNNIARFLHKLYEILRNHVYVLVTLNFYQMSHLNKNECKCISLCDCSIKINVLYIYQS